MHLLIHLIARLVAVVLLCLAGAAAWVMVDAHRSIEAEATASADRINHQLQSIYWQRLLWRGGMTREVLIPSPEWQTLTTLSILSPGVCVTFAPPGGENQKLCSQVDALGRPAPKWFASLYGTLFGPYQPVKRALSVRDKDAGIVLTQPEPSAALRQSWHQVSVVVGVAAALAAGIAILATLMIGHALMPARAIIDGLRRLEQGDHSWRLPTFQTVEFRHIARAVNDLAERLAQTTAARAALTTRLFQVQEEERRALARDLHDEFGQCLTATAALATLIEENATPDREDIAQDARQIAKIQKRLMKTLRGALVRLRSQDIDEVGLEASLRQLISDCNTQSPSRAKFRLNVAGQLTALPKQIAVDVYRIAQECLNNAGRHGAPTEVRLSVERISNAREAVALTVEDNGGGDASRLHRDHGYGILGIRERITALGGSFAIGRAPMGVRVTAMIPLMKTAVAFPHAEAHA